MSHIKRTISIAAGALLICWMGWPLAAIVSAAQQDPATPPPLGNADPVARLGADLQRLAESPADPMAALKTNLDMLHHSTPLASPHVAADPSRRSQPATVGAARWAAAGAAVMSLQAKIESANGYLLSIPEKLSAYKTSAAANAVDLAAMPSEQTRRAPFIPQTEWSVVSPASFDVFLSDPMLLAVSPEDTATPLPVEAEPAASSVADEAPPAASANPAEESGKPSQSEMNEMVQDVKKLLHETSRAARPAPSSQAASSTQPASILLGGVAPSEKAADKSDGQAVGIDAKPLPPGMDPLNLPVSLDFRDMELSNVVNLLAQKAQINILAGTQLTNMTVTASIKNVPLRQAIEMVLRMNGLGMVEEEGVFRIVSYEQAQQINRVSRTVKLQIAKATDVSKTLQDVLMGAPDATLVSVSANDATNVIIVSGPEKRVRELEQLALELDTTKPTQPPAPTVTETISLNYGEPADIQPIVESMLTKDVGKVTIDERGRNVIITDYPVAIEQMRQVIKSVDSPVKQVSIEAMIVDAVLTDNSETGVKWLLDLVQQRDASGNVAGLLRDRQDLRGNLKGSAKNGNYNANLGENIGTSTLNAGLLTFGVLTSKFDLQAAIAAEVQSRNAEILANPMLVSVENKKASISIVQQYPYQEITQSTQGPPVASTSFKDIGITLEVTPRVTHSNDIIAEILAKQSSISGTANGIPIEDKRETATTLKTADGRTIFIGGLRRVDDQLQANKVPVLGDVPIMNVLFRNTQVNKTHTELLVFLTCRVVGENLPELTVDQQEEYDKLGDVPQVPNAQREMVKQIVKPGQMREPLWKGRRAK